MQNKTPLKIENGFVEQKWTLKDDLFKFSPNHCGMNSYLKALYFKRPVLRTLFNMEQFHNSIVIDCHSVELFFLFDRLLLSFSLSSLIRVYDHRNFIHSHRIVPKSNYRNCDQMASTNKQREPCH